MVLPPTRVAAREALWARCGAGVLLAGLAGVLAFLGWRSLGWPLIHDAPIMHYAAWRIDEGAVPYRDLFDMNFPGVYPLHGLFLALFGSGDGGFRGFDLLWLALTAALSVGYCRKFGGWSAAAGALLFAAYHLAGGAWQAAQRDFLLCPFLLLGLWGIALAVESGRRHWFLVAGSGFGAAALVKPSAFLFLAVLAWAGARRRQLPLAIMAWTAPLLAGGLWLGWLGGLTPFLEMLGRYHLPLYSGLARVSPLSAIAWHSYGPLLWSLIALLAGLSIVVALTRHRFELRRRLLALGAGYGIVHFVAQGKGWEYHLYPLALFALLLAAAELDAVIRNDGAATRVLLGAGLALLVVVLGVKGGEASSAEWITAKERRVNSLAADLRGRIPPGETVQVLDTTEGGIHALLRLRVRQPTRFLYDFHFFHDAEAPYIRSLRSEFVKDLAARPPRFVVLFERGWPAGGYERLHRFPELRQWLEATYTFDRERDGYRIYARR